MEQQRFQAWVDSHCTCEYDLIHKVRFIETYLRLERHLPEGGRVLELGEESKISGYLKAHNRCRIETYGSDLRYPFVLKDSSYDVVLCLEVIEHIKDRTETLGINEIGMFTGSGVHNVFSECRRVLKSGGVLFLTTPNACSVDALSRIFLYQNPYQYPPHVREFAAAELRQYAEQYGFEEVDFSTAYVWYPLPGVDRKAIENMLIQANIPAEDRGDDMFMAFKKK